MIMQKIVAVLLVGLTAPVIILDGDATATVFMLFIAVPMFFSKKKLNIFILQEAALFLIGTKTILNMLPLLEIINFLRSVNLYEK